ncbi:MAG: hypothetical protein EGS63_01470 [Lachnospira sp.]|nr:hypothetical protein [Lachnospira sp.]
MNKKMIIIISILVVLLLGAGGVKILINRQNYNELKNIDENYIEEKNEVDKEIAESIINKETENSSNEIVYNGKKYIMDKEGYYSYQKAYKALLMIEQSSASLIHYYFIDDISNDGVPELIIIRGNSESDLELCVYAYDVVSHTQYFVGNYIAPYVQVYDRANKAGLAVISTYGDEEYIRELEIKNFALTDVVADDPQEAIKYYKNNNKIVTYQIDDYTPLNNESGNENKKDVIGINASNASYRECYMSQLQNDKYEKNNIAGYYVYDINSDDIPELIEYKGKSGDTLKIYVYSYDEILHTIYYVGNYYAPASVCYSRYNNKNGITIYSMFHGIETYYDLEIKNKLLISNQCNDIENFKKHKSENELKNYDINDTKVFEY